VADVVTFQGGIDSIGDAFRSLGGVAVGALRDIVKELVAAAAKAAIFKGILSIFGGGAGGSLGSTFKSVLGGGSGGGGLGLGGGKGMIAASALAMQKSSIFIQVQATTRPYATTAVKAAAGRSMWPRLVSISSSFCSSPLWHMA
jgi:hypothetical protein